MRVKLVNEIGFCSGVRRAFELVLRASVEHSSSEVYTLGPLIHNPQAVELLKKRGVIEVKNTDGLGSDGIVVIRTHGVPPEIIEKLKQSGCRIVNATCPKVERVQKLAQKYVKEGYKIVLVGDRGHPEIEALMGFSENKGIIVDKVEDLEKIELDNKTCVLFQTTFEMEKFKEAIEIITRKSPETVIFNTLCNTTSIRQQELLDLSESVDAIVIVGGKNSANTRRLYELACRTNKPVFWVETADEIKPDQFLPFKTVGVAAGASTPSWIISEVVEKLEPIGSTSRSFLRWKWLKNLAYFLVQSKIFAAVGSIGISLIFSFALQVELALPTLLFPVFFIIAFNTFGEIKDWAEFPIGEIAKARFFTMYQRELKTLGISSLTVTGFILFLFNMRAFIIGLLVTLLFFLYANKYFPLALRKLPVREIITTIGWIFSTNIFQLIVFSPEYSRALVFIMPFLVSLVFARSLYSSIIDLRCDRVLGLDSIVTRIGERRIQTLIDTIIILGSIPLFWGILKSFFPLKYYALFILPLYLGLLPLLIPKKRKSSGYAQLLLDLFLYIAIGIAFFIKET